MTAACRYNRTTAQFVALLYLFFSTFGAVAHTHATLDSARRDPATVGATADNRTHALSCHVSGARDCAACEWQALNVTQPAAAMCAIDSALVGMVPTVPSFSCYNVCQARFSSRAPPSV